MARNWYGEAIEVVSADKDFKKIVIEIAKLYPKAVVMADIAANGKSWQEQCREIMLSGRKIDAIKLCRSLTGMGLHEAKEAVESLI